MSRKSKSQPVQNEEAPLIIHDEDAEAKRLVEDAALAAWVESEKQSDFETFAHDAKAEIAKILERTTPHGFSVQGWFDNSSGQPQVGINLRPLKEDLQSRVV